MSTMPAGLPDTPLISIEDYRRMVGGAHWFGTWLGGDLTDVEAGRVRFRLPLRPEFFREGGTVAGPIIMAVADIALYAAVMTVHERGKSAVTSDMTMHFLGRPGGDALIGDARIIKAGRRLVVGEVWVRTEGVDDAVCHVTGTYALPAGKKSR